MENKLKALRPRDRLFIVIGVTIVLTISAIAYLALAHSGIIKTICTFKYFTGLDCPGCGGTRMVYAILDLDFYQAFRYNPYVFVTGLPMLIYTIYNVIVFIKTGTYAASLDKVLIVFAFGLIIFGIIRNIGIFSWLKPTLILN